MSEWDGWYYASQSAQLLLAGWWWNLALERYYLLLVCDRPSHGEQDRVSLLSILIILFPVCITFQVIHILCLRCKTHFDVM